MSWFDNFMLWKLDEKLSMNCVSSDIKRYILDLMNMAIAINQEAENVDTNKLSSDLSDFRDLFMSLEPWKDFIKISNDIYLWWIELFSIVRCLFDVLSVEPEICIWNDDGKLSSVSVKYDLNKCIEKIFSPEIMKIINSTSGEILDTLNEWNSDVSSWDLGLPVIRWVFGTIPVNPWCGKWTSRRRSWRIPKWWWNPNISDKPERYLDFVRLLTELWIDNDEIVVYNCKDSSYKIMVIESIGRTVFVSDEYGKASYIIKSSDFSPFIGKTASELRFNKYVATMCWFCNDNLDSKISGYLMNDFETDVWYIDDSLEWTKQDYLYVLLREYGWLDVDSDHPDYKSKRDIAIWKLFVFDCRRLRKISINRNKFAAIRSIFGFESAISSIGFYHFISFVFNVKDPNYYRKKYVVYELLKEYWWFDMFIKWDDYEKRRRDSMNKLYNMTHQQLVDYKIKFCGKWLASISTFFWLNKWNLYSPTAFKAFLDCVFDIDIGKYLSEENVWLN